MKLQKKLLSLLLVLVLAFSVFSISAFAYATEDRIRTVKFEESSIRLDPDDTYTLKPIWEPSHISLGIAGTDYRYSSSDTNVAYVDDNGVIYAYENGQATITLRITGNGTASCTATVTVGRDSYNPNSSSRSTSTVTTTSEAIAAGLVQERSGTTKTTTKKSTTSASGAIELTGKASREEVVACAQSGTPLSNYATVSAESLQAASASKSVMFDTKASSGGVVGRLTVTPANAKNLTGDLNTGVYAGTGNTKKVQDSFEKNFRNNVKVILCDQKNFGMNVSIAVSVGNMDASNLKFYSYDASTNSYSPLTVSGVTKDANKYLHFTTSTGGYIVVSEGTLSK